MGIYLWMILAMGAEPARIELDELFIGRLFFSAQNEKQVAFSYFERAAFKFAVFNFVDGKVTLVDDGRFTPMISFPIPWRQGFAVVSTVSGVAYFLGADGAFLEKAQWSGFKGWEQGFKIKFLSPLPSKGQAAATLTSRDRGRFLLAVMDLNTRGFEIIFEKTLKHEDYDVYWVRTTSAWLELIPQTASIQQLDAKTFKAVQRLRQAEEPWQRKTPRRSGKFSKILDQPLPLGDDLYLKWTQYRDNNLQPLDEPRISTLLLQNRKATVLKHHVLGIQGKKALVFKWEEGELAVIDL